MKRFFGEEIKPSDGDKADSEWRARVNRHIVNNNHSSLKIDCILSELPRFEYHYLFKEILFATQINLL